ncbi:MAG: type III pantothenate kinase [bacterium]|nr:type III pantothenate kinase [bacterium]
MILVIDIGNTNTHFGIYNIDEIEKHWFIPNSVIREQNNIILSNLKDYIIKQCTISCVVPSLKDVFNKIISNNLGFSPFFIDHSFIKIPIHYNNPSDLGIDRIINAVAVIKLYRLPCIIVDFGTATTFDVISKDCEFIGGVIAPGIGVSIETLWTKTEKLPIVEINVPKSVIGRSTVDCMYSGIFYGFIGQVNEIIRRIQDEQDGKAINCIATGGLSGVISPYIRCIKQIDPLLILKGLKILTD